MVELPLHAGRTRALIATAAVLLVLTSPGAAIAAQRIDVRIGTATYQPAFVTATHVGDRVRWSNQTSPSRVHDVVSSLPDYFHMPLGGSGGVYAFTFRSAGYFTYFCSIHDTMLGAVSVPLIGSSITDASGTHFHLVLNSAALPAGSRYVSVVSVQAPGDAAAHHWRTTRRASVDYVPSVAGSYTFTAVVRDTQTGHLSGATPPLTFTFGG